MPHTPRGEEVPYPTTRSNTVVLYAISRVEIFVGPERESEIVGYFGQGFRSSDLMIH